MERKQNIDLFGATALTGFSLLLAVNQVVIKLSIAGFSPVFMAGLRSAGAAVLLLAWMWARSIPRDLPPGALPWGIVLGLLFGIEFILLFMALDMTTVSRASVLFYTMPVWLSLGAHLLLPGERLTWLKSLGLLAAVCGVALALSDRGGGTQSWAGDLMALAASMCWAAIALVVRTTPMGNTNPETQLLWQLMVSACVILLATPLFGPFLRALEWTHMAGLAFQIVVVINMGFLMWFWLLSIYPAAGVASFSFLSPVFSVLLGWLVLSEEVSAQIWLALVLVALGIVLIIWPRAGGRKPTRD